MPASKRDLHQITLCLSGGGFRAAAYHLGALRRLHELGLMPLIDEYRAVSGGSIVAAWLGKQLATGLSFPDLDWERDVAAPLRELLSRDMRTAPVIATAPGNWLNKHVRVGLLERKLSRLLGDTTLGALPARPRIVFLATDLLSGKLVKMGKGLKTGAWPLTRAVVASAAFPPMFGPVFTRRLGGVEGAVLSDGGVWGNLGVASDVLEHGRVVMVSDASYPLLPIAFGRPRPTFWLGRALRVGLQRGDSALRYQMWLTDCVDQRFEVWRISHTTHGKETGLATLEYSQSCTEKISQVRTDLDAFSNGELGILENHGYLRAASGLSWLLHRIRLHGVGEGVRGENLRMLEKIANQEHFPLVRVPHPELMSERRVFWELAGSSHRVLKFRLVRRLRLLMR